MFRLVRAEPLHFVAQLCGIIYLQARLQFIAEVRPRIGEMFLQALEHRRVDDLACLHIHEAFANLIELLAPLVIRQSLDHAVAARGNHHRIERVVAVAFFTHFDQSPTRAQE